MGGAQHPAETLPRWKGDPLHTSMAPPAPQTLHLRRLPRQPSQNSKYATGGQ